MIRLINLLYDIKISFYAKVIGKIPKVKQSKETLIIGFYYLVLYVYVVYAVSLFLYVLLKKKLNDNQKKN